MTTINYTKINKILICFNLFNEKNEFKYNCHAQISGERKEYYNICAKLCKELNNSRKYNKAWFECFFFNKIGKTIYKSYMDIIIKGINPEELQRIINHKLKII